jgi:hypothetical protein
MGQADETRTRWFQYVCNAVREAQRGRTVHGNTGAEQVFSVKSERKKDIRVIFELVSVCYFVYVCCRQRVAIHLY